MTAGRRRGRLTQPRVVGAPAEAGEGVGDRRGEVQVLQSGHTCLGGMGGYGPANLRARGITGNADSDSQGDVAPPRRGHRPVPAAG